MRLVTPEIEIDENDPFKNDKLNRKPFAESLLSLITNVEDNLVISLDASWGDGKTTFVKMWQGFLKSSGVKSLYFDAFANDSFEDPFMALVSSIDLLIEKEFFDKPTAMKKLNEFKDKAVRVGTKLLSWGAKIGVKAITLNVIKDKDIEQLKEIAEDIASDAGESTSKFVEDKLNSYKEVLGAKDEFTNKLNELAEEAYKETRKPLVLIIDELDRCKPTYALELIEKVKHLFSVKRIVYVLVMHTTQLEESVKCVYGQNIDARTYMQKFINIECKLPKNTMSVYENDYVKYCAALCDLHGLDESDRLVKMMELLGKVFKLSMRDLQRCFTNIVLTKAAGQGRFFEPDLVSLIIVLKVKKPDIYDRLKTNRIAFKKLWDELELDGLVQAQGDIKRKNRLSMLLRTYLLPDVEFSGLDDQSDEKECWRNRSYDFDLEDRTQVLPYFCGLIESFKFLQEEI